MPKLTPQELQQWYAQLKTVLYEQANIDLNRKEDMGRVRIYHLNEYHYDNPDAIHDVDMIYPFIPHRPLAADEESPDPMLSYFCYDPAPPDRNDFDTYHQWLLDNMNQPSDETIQEMYNMVEEGQLIIYDGSEIPGQRQVRMENGEITLSDRIDNIPVEFPPEPVPLPKDHGPALPPRPEKPPEPGEEPKGFWTYVGYRLGLPTAYRKYMDRKDEYDRYLGALDTWKQQCKDLEEQWEAAEPDRMKNLKEQTNAFNNYYQAMVNYYTNPDSRFGLLSSHHANKLSAKSMATLTKIGENGEVIPVQNLVSEANIAEISFWGDLHDKSPLGKMQAGISEANETSEEILEVSETVNDMFGPVYNNPTNKVGKDVLAIHKNESRYVIPPVLAHNNDNITEEHAAFICLAALSDSELLEQDLSTDQRLKNLGSQARYQAIVDAFLVNGESGSEPLFRYIHEARKNGAKAMQDYAKNDPTKMATLIGSCIRRQNKIIANQTDAHALKSAIITAGLLDVMDAHSSLLEHCGLASQELQQARANAAILKINEAGLKAKADLLNYALNRNSLGETQLRTAAADVLLMNTMNAKMEKGEPIITDPATIQATKQELIKGSSVTQLVTLGRRELGKAIALPRKQLDQMPQVHSEVPKPQIKPAEPQMQAQVPQQAPLPSSHL